MPPKRQPAGVVRTAAEWKKIIDDQQNGIGMAIRINGDRKEVWEGKAYKTPSKGLTKKDLKLDPYGKVVSKLKSANSKRVTKEWRAAVTKAKDELKVGKKGDKFVPIGGKSKAGKALLAAARKEHAKKKK